MISSSATVVEEHNTGRIRETVCEIRIRIDIGRWDVSNSAVTEEDLGWAIFSCLFNRLFKTAIFWVELSGLDFILEEDVVLVNGDCSIHETSLQGSIGVLLNVSDGYSSLSLSSGRRQGSREVPYSLVVEELNLERSICKVRARDIFEEDLWFNNPSFKRFILENSSRTIEILNNLCAVGEFVWEVCWNCSFNFSGIRGRHGEISSRGVVCELLHDIIALLNNLCCKWLFQVDNSGISAISYDPNLSTIDEFYLQCAIREVFHLLRHCGIIIERRKHIWRSVICYNSSIFKWDDFVAKIITFILEVNKKGVGLPDVFHEFEAFRIKQGNSTIFVVYLR